MPDSKNTLSQLLSGRQRVQRNATALVTVAVLVTYEAWLAVAQRRRPKRMARAVHANLRQDWFEAVSAQKGSEVLAAQTLRNSLMSASMTASTAALALMGTVTLAAPSLHAEFGDAASALPHFTPRLARKRWTSAGTAYVRKAGVLYSWGLRRLVLIAPVVAFILHPLAGPIAALVVCGVLFNLDRFEPTRKDAG